MDSAAHLSKTPACWSARTAPSPGPGHFRDLGFLGPSLAALATTGATAAPRLLNAIAMVSATGGHGDLLLPRTMDRGELFRVLDMRPAVADGPVDVSKAVRR